MKKERVIPSADNKHHLHTVIWEPEGEVCAILQISHGMVEYVERFEEFAEELNRAHILVIGNDHLGHGKTAGAESDLGYFGKGKSDTLVEDLHRITAYIHAEYPQTPIFLFGHSMGSFLARKYIMYYGTQLSGVILSGTGYTPNGVLRFAKILSGWLQLIKGERYRSSFLKKLSFSGYLKRIEQPRTETDWLTRDEKVIDAYNRNKFCTYTFTVNGYRTLFELLEEIQEKKHIKKTPKQLPILLISGKEDPVGNYGVGVETVYKLYQREGLTDIEKKLYEKDRHELTNELDKETVFADIKEWIMRYL